MLNSSNKMARRKLRLECLEVEVVQDNKSGTCLGLMDCCWIPAMVQQLLPRVNSGTASTEDDIDMMDTIGMYDSE